MAKKQTKPATKTKPAARAVDAPPEGYFEAPVHGFQWPPPGTIGDLRGALTDIDTAAPLGEGQPVPALVVYVDQRTSVYDVAARRVVDLDKGKAVRILDPAFAKFARLLVEEARLPHLIVRASIVAGRPRFRVFVSIVPVLAADYTAAAEVSAAAAVAAGLPSNGAAAAHS